MIGHRRRRALAASAALTVVTLLAAACVPRDVRPQVKRPRAHGAALPTSLRAHAGDRRATVARRSSLDALGLNAGGSLEVPGYWHETGWYEGVVRDGTTAVFVVTRQEQYPKDAFPSDEVYGNIGHAGLRLITCSGDFDEQTNHYRANRVVYAKFARAEY